MFKFIKCNTLTHSFVALPILLVLGAAVSRLTSVACVADVALLGIPLHVALAVQQGLGNAPTAEINKW